MTETLMTSKMSLTGFMKTKIEKNVDLNLEKRQNFKLSCNKKEVKTKLQSNLKVQVLNWNQFLKFLNLKPVKQD